MLNQMFSSCKLPMACCSVQMPSLLNLICKTAMPHVLIVHTHLMCRFSMRPANGAHASWLFAVHCCRYMRVDDNSSFYLCCGQLLMSLFGQHEPQCACSNFSILASLGICHAIVTILVVAAASDYVLQQHHQILPLRRSWPSVQSM